MCQIAQLELHTDEEDDLCNITGAGDRDLRQMKKYKSVLKLTGSNQAIASETRASLYRKRARKLLFS